MVTYCDGQRRWGNARRGRAERCADACAAAEERIRRLRVSEKSGGGRSRRFREIGTSKCESETGAHTICLVRFFLVKVSAGHSFQRVSFVVRFTTTLRSAPR
jgi:hypothetical protein